ncbi:MAG: winged helix-turn-helix transcriptional regulator [Patescibacteria group bacterium]|nr:winged helix-turn-helix transcriptional regulator [Patescibacteria group bacterium]
MKRRERVKPIHPLFFQIMKYARTDLDAWLHKTKSGITSLQFGILRTIGAAKKPLSFNELARHLFLRPPSILPSIDTLEKRKYITRRPDAADRRKIILLITAKGKRMLVRVGTQHRDSIMRALKKMGERKEQQLISLLEELVERIHLKK